MNRILTFCVLLILGISQSGAQKKAGLFGRKFYIGWEHSIRPFGSLSARLDSRNPGLGKIKVEKLINNNRTLGFSFEKRSYMINEEREYLNFYGVYVNEPQRYLTTRTYGVFLKKYYTSRGIAPIGNYVSLHFDVVRSSTDTKINAKKFSFLDVYVGAEFGKSFPLLGKRLIGNFSIGCYFSEGSLLESTFADSPSGLHRAKPYDLNVALLGMNVIKANVGISYALF